MMYTTRQVLGVMHKHQLNSGGFCEPNEVGQCLHGIRNFTGQVNFSARKMGEIKRVKTRASFCFSYGLKHEVERLWTEGDKEMSHGYIGNGAVIVAAYLMGIEVVPHGSLNAFIGISKSDTYKKWRKK